MLVLSRKQSESIHIGDDIVVTVVRTKGKAVRIGIQAPGHISVLRGELVHAINVEERQKVAAEKQAAEAVDAADDPGETELQPSAPQLVAVGCSGESSSWPPGGFRSATPATTREIGTSRETRRPLRELIRNRTM